MILILIFNVLLKASNKSNRWQINVFGLNVFSLEGIWIINVFLEKFQKQKGNITYVNGQKRTLLREIVLHTALGGSRGHLWKRWDNIEKKRQVFCPFLAMIIVKKFVNPSFFSFFFFPFETKQGNIKSTPFLSFHMLSSCFFVNLNEG